MFDAGHRFQLLFQRRSQPFLHIFRRSAAPLDAHADKIEIEIGKELNVELGHGKQAGQHQNQHEQIGRHRMVDKSAEQVLAFHELNFIG